MAIRKSKGGKTRNPRPRSTPKEEARWRTIERVAALVERQLDPSAHVEHNVNLPDLTTEGIARQCDVVVTSGPEKRPTRSIVEVQKRGRRVELAMFEGWVAKMRAVGAQHLVCVSSVGYPASVVSKAAQLGPTVRLCTLKELERPTDLLDGVWGTSVHRRHTIRSIDDIRFVVRGPAPRGIREFNKDAELFRIDAERTVTFNELARYLVNKEVGQRELLPGTHQFSLKTEHEVAFLQEGGVSVRISFLATVDVEVATFAEELLEYRQLPDDDAMTWIVVARAPAKGDEPAHDFQVTFAPGADGRLRPCFFTATGMSPNTAFSAHIAGESSGTILIR